MDKILKLLEIAKKFGVKPSKVIGTQGNIVPYKKPSLVAVNVDEFKLKESIDSGAMTMDKVQQEMEETVRLALSKNLNDVELNRALNNAINIERQFFPPSAEVIAAGSKQQVTGKGLEELIDKEGLVASPKTPLGKIQFGNKRAEYEMNKIIKESDLDSLLKGINKDRLAEMRLHNEGLVRAVTRQILSEDIKAGKIKSLTLDDLGTSREPIDYFRKIYGENALEQLDSLIPDFNRLNTEQEAASLARSKFKFEPDEFRLKGSTSYEDVEKAKTTEKEKGFFERLFGSKKQEKEPAEVLDITAEGNKRKSVDELIDEYNANQDRTRLLDEEGGSKISYEEFQDIQKKNEEIAKELEKKGVKSTPEPEEVKPEGIVIPFRKKFPKPEPEDKAQGGIIGYALGGRTGFAEGTPMAGLAITSIRPVNTNMTQEQINQYINSPVPIGLMVPQNEMLPNETYLDFVKRKRKEEMYPLSLTANILPGTGGFPGGPLSPTTTTSDSTPLTVRDRYNKYLSAAGSGTSDELYKSYRANLDKKADGGRIGFAGGKSKTILDLIAEANKKLKGKKSMESVNPKTGEVTVSKKPVKTAEEPTGVTVMDQEPVARTTQDIEKEIDELTTTPITTLEKQRKYNELHSEFINSLDPRRQKKALDYRRNSLDTENRLILKAEEQGLDFDTFEKLRTGLYGPRKQQTLNYIKTGKVNVEPVKPTTTFEEVQKRYRTAAKAADEIFPNYDTPKTSASELANVMAEQKYGKVFDDISGDKQTELYEEAYNYITSVNRLDKVSPPNRIAPPGQEFNISDPKTAEAFTNFARENDPEGFKKIQKIVDDINNKNALEEFDPTGRKPNAKGGSAGGLDYLMGF